MMIFRGVFSVALGPLTFVALQDRNAIQSKCLLSTSAIVIVFVVLRAQPLIAIRTVQSGSWDLSIINASIAVHVKCQVWIAITWISAICKPWCHPFICEDYRNSHNVNDIFFCFHYLIFLCTAYLGNKCRKKNKILLDFFKLKKAIGLPGIQTFCLMTANNDPLS
jgi:hypothetical protein